MLGEERDAVGMPRLRIGIRFSEDDVEGIVRPPPLGRVPAAARRGADRVLFADAGAAIRDRLGGGFHQSGTTRMSARPEDGVVDPNLAVHGLPTLYVASSSAFPTSSQANSTFMIVVFALRLAEHLAGCSRETDNPRAGREATAFGRCGYRPPPPIGDRPSRRSRAPGPDWHHARFDLRRGGSRPLHLRRSRAIAGALTQNGQASLVLHVDHVYIRPTTSAATACSSTTSRTNSPGAVIGSRSSTASTRSRP